MNERKGLVPHIYHPFLFVDASFPFLSTHYAIAPIKRKKDLLMIMILH
jgi:hypothetical protein